VSELQLLYPPDEPGEGAGSRHDQLLHKDILVIALRTSTDEALEVGNRAVVLLDPVQTVNVSAQISKKERSFLLTPPGTPTAVTELISRQRS